MRKPPTRDRTGNRERRELPPLDQAALERLALRYVERFATSQGRLTGYLTRKLRERGWASDMCADPAAVAERMVTLGYVDDLAFAEARAAALGRRGQGARRVDAEWRAAGIGEEERAELEPVVAERAEETALAFARRRRIGPFAPVLADRDARARQIAAMLRAGHGLDLARRIVGLPPGEPFEGAD